MPSSNQPLDGYRVVDVTTNMSGPLATMVLAVLKNLEGTDGQPISAWTTNNTGHETRGKGMITRRDIGTLTFLSTLAVTLGRGMGWSDSPTSAISLNS